MNKGTLTSRQKTKRNILVLIVLENQIFSNLCSSYFIPVLYHTRRPVVLFAVLGHSSVNLSWKTRMHSSRMRTSHFSSHLYVGVCLLLVRRGVYASGYGGCVYHHITFTTPPFTTPSPHPPFHHTPCEQTNTCENITLPQTSSAGGNDVCHLSTLLTQPLNISHMPDSNQGTK